MACREAGSTACSDHLLSCKHQRITTHNVLRDTVAKMCRQAGQPVAIEQRIDNGASKIDILLNNSVDPDHQGKMLCDVTRVQAYKTNTDRPEVDSILNNAENAKRNKYAAHAEAMDGIVVPLAITTFGVRGPSFSQFINHVKRAAYERGIYDRDIDVDFGRRWRENIAVTLARQNTIHVGRMIAEHRRVAVAAALGNV